MLIFQLLVQRGDIVSLSANPDFVQPNAATRQEASQLVRLLGDVGLLHVVGRLLQHAPGESVSLDSSHFKIKISFQIDVN